MENAGISHLYNSLELMITASATGVGKSMMWYDNPLIIRAHDLMLLAVLQSSHRGLRTLQKYELATLAFIEFRDEEKKDQRTDGDGKLAGRRIGMVRRADSGLHNCLIVT